MASSSSNDETLISGINVTPLVDIVLVLLVILMVTASYVASQSIPMDLPHAATGGETPTTPEPVMSEAERTSAAMAAVKEAMLVLRKGDL